MNYRGKTELQERLAAEYVLGTLRGRARQRFQAWMREDAALRRAVVEWEERLTPLATAVDPVQPPRRVWRSIESRIATGTSPQSATRLPAPSTSLWDSLAFWRNWGLIATGCVAALVSVNALWRPGMTEVDIERQVKARLDRLVRDEVARLSGQMQPSYIAVLEDRSRNLSFVAYAARKSDELWVKTIALAPLPAGTRYELWGLPAKEGDAPRSLGLVPNVDKGTIKLAAVADQSLSDFPKLAISLEPDGGSRTGAPTGPVMYVGACMKFW
jgi:anti-sigma-K factor RskA